jgi:hypothetical protein
VNTENLKDIAKNVRQIHFVYTKNKKDFAKIVVVQIYANITDLNINVKNAAVSHSVNTEDTKILAKNVEVPKYAHTAK